MFHCVLATLGSGGLCPLKPIGIGGAECSLGTADQEFLEVLAVQTFVLTHTITIRGRIVIQEIDTLVANKSFSRCFTGICNGLPCHEQAHCVPVWKGHTDTIIQAGGCLNGHAPQIVCNLPEGARISIGISEQLTHVGCGGIASSFIGSADTLENPLETGKWVIARAVLGVVAVSVGIQCEHGRCLGYEGAGTTVVGVGIRGLCKGKGDCATDMNKSL